MTPETGSRRTGRTEAMEPAPHASASHSKPDVRPRKRGLEEIRAPSAAGVSPGGLHQAGEGGRVGDRQLGQDLPVERDAGLLEAVHERRVRQPERPAAGVDPDDPERAELALLRAAIAVGEGEGAGDGLGRGAVEATAAAPLPLSLL